MMSTWQPVARSTAAVAPSTTCCGRPSTARSMSERRSWARPHASEPNTQTRAAPSWYSTAAPRSARLQRCSASGEDKGLSAAERPGIEVERRWGARGDPHADRADRVIAAKRADRGAPAAERAARVDQQALGGGEGLRRGRQRRGQELELDLASAGDPAQAEDRGVRYKEHAAGQ